jgi:glutamine amidotransferase
MLTIVDYGTGNLRSVQNMLKSLGVATRISSARDEIASASALILPGVGHFDFGMRSLKQLDLCGVLDEQVLERKTPLLGICLGAQLLTRGSEEGSEPGLGWIAAETRRFDRSRLDPSLRVPHMGWADTEFSASSALFAGASSSPRYYYVHAYHIVADNAADELCHAVHGYRFVAGVERGNIAGVQFHPEKSHRFGRQLLADFARTCGLVRAEG